MCIFKFKHILREYVHYALVGGKIVENFQSWYHFVFQILVTVGNLSMLYDSQTWSPCPFVANPDPLCVGCDCKEDCLTASCRKFCSGEGCVSCKIASVPVNIIVYMPKCVTCVLCGCY